MEKTTAISLVTTIRQSLATLNKGGYRVVASGYVQGFAPDASGKTHRNVYIELDDHSLRVLQDGPAEPAKITSA